MADGASVASRDTTPERPAARSRPAAAPPQRNRLADFLERLFGDDRSPTPTPTPTPGGVFISYRRSDEAGVAGRLDDRLVARFGRDAVFMDVDSIDLGLDFSEVIDRSLAQCRAVLVVIGRNWLGAADDQGRRRLDSPDDYVRLEVETALRRGIRVIPVLVEGARMPDRDALPPSLAPLVRRNGLPMSHARFAADVTALLDALGRIRPAP